MFYKTRDHLREWKNRNRTVRKFLWLPRSFPGDSHGRWLCYADIVEQVKQTNRGYDGGGFIYNYKWVEVGFADSYKEPMKSVTPWHPLDEDEYNPYGAPYRRGLDDSAFGYEDEKSKRYNLSLPFVFPLGSLVEVKPWGCRLFVKSHSRTEANRPVYWLALMPEDEGSHSEPYLGHQLEAVVKEAKETK